MDINMFYRDAVYFHLIHKGYSFMQADIISENVFTSNKKRFNIN